MARARNIKPAFFKDASVVSCSYEARLLFIGLWCLVDYTGRLKYIPIEIKMELFPADNVDIDVLMKELERSGLIQIYPDLCGNTLVQVVNFEKHQNPHLNERQGKDKKPMPCLPSYEEIQRLEQESKSKIESLSAATPESSGAIQNNPDHSASDPADSLIPYPDSPILIPDSQPPPLPGENISTEYLGGPENGEKIGGDF